MSTRAVYRLLDTGRLTGTQDGHRFPTAGRTSWTLTFEVQTLDGVTGLTLAVEASPTGNADAEFETIHSAALSSTGETVVSSSFSGRAINARDVWLRGAVTSVTGSGHYAARIYAAAPFFDPEDGSADLLLLRREIRSYDDTGTGEGRTRLIERAEGDVLTRLRIGALGELKQANLTQSGALSTIKDAIALQTDHLMQREGLAQSRDPSARVSLREFPRYAPGLDTVLQPVLWESAGIWRGR